MVLEDSRAVRVVVNGEVREADAPVRMLLSDFLRHRLGLTGTHVGCEQGVCGSCTIHLNGDPHRSCLLLAVQAHGEEITTIEGMREHPVALSFARCHAIQCGFCTAGLVMSATAFLREEPAPSRQAIVGAVSSNLCRCTGYQNIVRAVAEAAAEMGAQADERASPDTSAAVGPG